MGRQRDPALLEKADEFLKKYVLQDKKDVGKAAIAVRPDIKPESATTWGERILKDPDSRRKLLQIEQGALAKVYELADEAIDRLAAILRDESTSRATQVKVIDMVLRRILGGIPDTVILAKFSMFDGEQARTILAEKIRDRMLTANYERVVKDDDRQAQDTGV